MSDAEFPEKYEGVGRRRQAVLIGFKGIAKISFKRDSKCVTISNASWTHKCNV